MNENETQLLTEASGSFRLSDEIPHASPYSLKLQVLNEKIFNFIKPDYSDKKAYQKAANDLEALGDEYMEVLRKHTIWRQNNNLQGNMPCPRFWCPPVDPDSAQTPQMPI